MEFDSTPAVAASRSRSAVARWLSQVLDAIDMFWTEVITFDRVKQIGFFRSVRYNFRDVWERLRRLSLKVDAWSSLDWAEQLKVWDLNHLIYLLLAGVLAGALWLLNRQKFYLRLLWTQFFLKKPAGRIAPDYYLEMLEVLARKGLEKGPAETPTEFLQRVQPRFQSASPTLITELYHRNRFGNLPLRRSDLSDVHGWLKALKREWWQRGAPS